MKRFKLFTTIFIISSGYGLKAQTLNVTYKFNVGDSGHLRFLSINDTISLWKESSNSRNDGTPSSDLFLIKQKNTGFAYFNFTGIFSKPIYIKDTLNIMKWEITNDTTHILGYPCISAKLHFRGRDYLAYFTRSIQYSDGPWKFTGLPGLILSVKSVDGFFEWIATQIKFEPAKELEEIHIPKAEYVSWVNFQEKFIDLIEKIIKRLRSTTAEDPSVTGRFFKYDTPEIIYPKAQTGKGAEY